MVINNINGDQKISLSAPNSGIIDLVSEDNSMIAQTDLAGNVYRTFLFYDTNTDSPKYGGSFYKNPNGQNVNLDDINTIKTNLCNVIYAGYNTRTAEFPVGQDTEVGRCTIPETGYYMVYGYYSSDSNLSVKYTALCININNIGAYHKINWGYINNSIFDIMYLGAGTNIIFSILTNESGMYIITDGRYSGFFVIRLK